MLKWMPFCARLQSVDHSAPTPMDTSTSEFVSANVMLEDGGVSFLTCCSVVIIDGRRRAVEEPGRSSCDCCSQG